MLDQPRFEARQDGEEWGVWDTQAGGWVAFGRYDAGGAVSRWPLQSRAGGAAQRMNDGTPEDRRRWTRHGLP